ncbi:hypothetical protein D3C81_2275100 [compost metagenome]
MHLWLQTRQFEFATALHQLLTLNHSRSAFNAVGQFHKFFAFLIVKQHRHQRVVLAVVID